MSDPIQIPLMLEFDGAGGAVEVDWNSADKGRDNSRFHWIQADWRGDSLRQQLVDDFGVDPVLATAALETDTRPSYRRIGDSTLVILRAANHHPDEKIEDLISVRLIVDQARGFTLSRHKLRTTDDIADQLRTGEGPRNASEFFASYIDILIDRMAPIIAELSEDLDQVEDDVLDPDKPTREGPLAGVRRRIIKLRRYLAPQREALDALTKAKLEWLRDEDRGRIRESGFQLAKIVDDLDAFRDRGQLIQEEILFQINQRLSRNTFLLTLVAGVLLPLNLVTGMFGMNVGGVPGGTWPFMFWAILVSFLTFLGIATVAVLRSLKARRQ